MFAGARAIATALAMVSVSFAAVVRSGAHASARERHSRERCPSVRFSHAFQSGSIGNND
jgi:hypothetical protein